MAPADGAKPAGQASLPGRNSLRWSSGGESGDIEDRRDESGGGGGFRFGGMHIGIGGAIILLILSFVFKTNLFTVLNGGTGEPGTAAVRQPSPARDAAEKPLVEFVSFALDDTQKTWTQILPEQTGKSYRHTKLMLFRDDTQSGCGGDDRPPGLSIVPKMKRCTSIWAFSMSSVAGSGRRASLRRLTF